MRKPVPKQPVEVKRLLKETPARLLQLTADGWCVELTEIYDLSVEYNLGLHTPDPNTHTIGEVGETGEASEVMTAQVGVPTVQFFEASREDLRLPPERRPAWIVDANASDANILDGVKHALEERRKSNPPPVAKRGRHAPNNCFDDATLAKWRADKIVQLARLFAWRAMLDPKEARRYPDHVLGQWLGFAGPKSKASLPKKTSMAKSTLRQALARRRGLLAQITQEAALTAATQEIAMAWLFKNMTGGRDASGNPEVLIPQQITMTVAQAIDTRKRRS
jgi:hypothetical protein